jgi:S-adenosylmethionine:tRNA ribosyltransferase-isomerase
MHEVKDYDYELPEELIAAHPLAGRADSRMLVVNRASGEISHHSVRELPRFLRPHDCLILNDTKVLPARLFGTRTQTGGKWEGLYLGTGEDQLWKLIGQTRGRLLEGERIQIRPAGKRLGGKENAAAEFFLTLVSRDAEGVWLARPEPNGDPMELLNAFGTMPLPPYIKRPVAEESDWQRYQTTYARHPGAVAAPTAGLHLTRELRDQCRAAGAFEAFVTLHVGIGTFRPITAEKLSEHQMHAEWCELSREAASVIGNSKEASGRIVAVGTTSVRTLESASRMGNVQPFQGETNLFVRPGYEFRSVDGLLTNFHLPKSTLLVLVSAFAGFELIQRAYQEAIRERYRFYSYGDAMLIL